MQQQGSSPGFLEGGAKCGHQFVGKLADKADRIGQDHCLAGVEVEAPQGGIQPREQPVRGAHARPGQFIEEGRFTGIGVANEGHHGGARAASGSPTELPARADPMQASLNNADAFSHQPPIALELFLTRSAQSDTTFLAFQVRPAPHQARR